MKRHFHNELKKLKDKLLEMSFTVGDALAKACEALLEGNTELAREVLSGEKKVNQLEIDIDDQGHSLFALGQPMAVDLRLITMILKINTDLERIGDHAVNIAEACLRISEEPFPFAVADFKIPLREMAELVQKMLRSASDAFLKEDAKLAEEVLKGDDAIDDFHDKNLNLLKRRMEKNPVQVGQGLNYVVVSHNLERIGDLANNIAEDVIYWIQAREVRHHTSPA